MAVSQNKMNFKMTVPTKYLIISDLQIPDHNKFALQALYHFIPDFKPDKLFILGDFLNCTPVSRFTTVDDLDDNLNDEIEIGKQILDKLVELSKCEVVFFEGNHENRLGKYLSTEAPALKSLKVRGERYISLQHLLGIREKKIKWVDYFDHLEEHSIRFMHGHKVNKYAGYTAQNQLTSLGMSGFSGHTHRLALVFRRQGHINDFWCETGCLCNLNPYPRWTTDCDWCSGFAVGHYYPESHAFYPQIIPIIHNTFIYNGKVYKP